MTDILIIGSGASGVHFALSVLKKGYDVVMLDVGNEKPETVNPSDSFTELKENLSDPAGYLLGEDCRGVIFPDNDAEYYGFPPSKDYIFKEGGESAIRSAGFSPLSSYCRGGLAEAWTGGCFPFNNDELSDFPFNYPDIAPYYDEVSYRIGISGVDDDLSIFFPIHKHLMPPLDLDDQSAYLLNAYLKKKGRFNDKLKCFIGRSRTATLSRDKDSRKACSYDGRCLWGCPCEALYTPSMTLNECITYPNFKYIPDVSVSHFKFTSGNKIKAICAKSLITGAFQDFNCDILVLAAGTLSSSRIFLNSILNDSGKMITLPGLMDNRQILVPFVNLNMIGKDYNPNSYQYHQLALGLPNGTAKHYVHGLITTLKTTMSHPIIQSIPFDLKTSIFAFRNLRSSLGILNINFHDTRRSENYLGLERPSDSPEPVMTINYSPDANEKTRIKGTIKAVKEVLRHLGCLVPPGLIHIRPMGASVHYSGTIPMSKESASLTVSTACQSHDFQNLFIVDGTTYPFLPAKNLTMTLMANAARVAETSF